MDTPLPRPAAPAMALLVSGVPLSLLLDLAYGPFSEEVLAMEPPLVRDGA